MVKRCQSVWAAWIMWIITAWAVCVAMTVSGAQAAETKEPQAEAGASPPALAPGSAAENLSTNQQQLASEFKDLQGILMKMRDQVRQTDPNRAVLIEKALKESGERHVDAEFPGYRRFASPRQVRRCGPQTGQSQRGSRRHPQVVAQRRPLAADPGREGPASANTSISSTTSSASRRMSRAARPAAKTPNRSPANRAPGPANGQSVQGHWREPGEGPQQRQRRRKGRPEERRQGRRQAAARRATANRPANRRAKRRSLRPRIRPSPMATARRRILPARATAR